MKIAPLILFTFVSVALAAQAQSIPFGSALDADQQIAESQKLAKDLLATPNPQLRAKGDQHRTYNFPAANKAMPYRLYVPTTWDGQSRLPLIVLLHGAGSDENRYMDSNNKQVERLAEQHGYIVVSPLGYSPMGAYGTPLRLPAVFGQPETAAKQRAAVTPEAEHTLELSEKDVINVLEIVLNEYPVKRSAVFLAGHSMGSGGTWYLGAKYSQYWRAIAPMSGPVRRSGELSLGSPEIHPDHDERRHAGHAIAAGQPRDAGLDVPAESYLRVLRSQGRPRRHGATGPAGRLRFL